MKHEEVLQSRNLWDNQAKSHETLSDLSDAIRAVDRLKDLLYKLWTERLFDMYTSWARGQGCKEGLVENIASTSGRIQFAAMEIESEYMFGTLAGEKGMHRMIYSSVDNSGTGEAISARVDVIPLFLDRPLHFYLDDNDLEISPSSECENQGRGNGGTVRVQHMPSGVTAESSGERSYFANKLEAMSRLKAKLLIITTELGVSGAKMIEKQVVEEKYYRETRQDDTRWGPRNWSMI
uniref:Uncharacterized protein n=1 Tax=Avena sativa TaxID=4498 RepID=A0ACD5U5Z0_AVESA